MSEIEGSFGFLTQQIKSVHKDLLGFQEKTEQAIERLDNKFSRRLDSVDGRLDRVETEVRTLRKDMPGIVGEAMRATMRERRAKPGKE